MISPVVTDLPEQLLMLSFSDDPWNQTPVDNVEWLREFKREVGLPVDNGQHVQPSVLHRSGV